MNTLKQFSEKELDYHRYQARQNFLREQQTIRGEYEQDLERERAEKERERREKEKALRREVRERVEKEQERAAKEQALAEVERLTALLARKDGAA